MAAAGEFASETGVKPDAALVEAPVAPVEERTLQSVLDVVGNGIAHTEVRGLEILAAGWK